MTLCRSLLDGIEDDGDADLQGRIIEGRCTGKRGPFYVSVTATVTSCSLLILHVISSSLVSVISIVCCKNLAFMKYVSHIEFNVNVQCAWVVLTKMTARKEMRSFCAMDATQRRISGA